MVKAEVFEGYRDDEERLKVKKRENHDIRCALKILENNKKEYSKILYGPNASQKSRKSLGRVDAIINGVFDGFDVYTVITEDKMGVKTVNSSKTGRFNVLIYAGKDIVVLKIGVFELAKTFQINKNGVRNLKKISVTPHGKPEKNLYANYEPVGIDDLNDFVNSNLASECGIITIIERDDTKIRQIRNEYEILEKKAMNTSQQDLEEIQIIN